MQEVRYDGTEQLSRLENAEQLQKAIDDPRNKSVSVHKAGSIITMRDGTKYEVMPAGNWKRL